jgi:Domain of unknown function (DUF4111)/Nucleotidyltransferase domain
MMVAGRVDLHSKIPSSIQPLLAEFLSHLQEQFGEVLVGLYVQGSIALGAYIEGQSDIDFVAVLNRHPSAYEIEVLQALHRHLREKYPRPALEGQYLQTGQLGRLDNEVEGYPNYHDGVLHPDDHHGLNLVMWSVLKNQGITLRGTPAQELPIKVDWNRLISEMVVNLNTYWAGWTRQPDKLVRLYFDSGFQWAALGVLRLFYTFRERSITSKVGAGEYALTVLPEEWKPVVQQALALREGRQERYFRWRAGRMMEAVRFIRYVIAECNKAL